MSSPTPVRLTLQPRSITVLYDHGCPVCRRARRWVQGHHQVVPVEFVPAGSKEAVERFPGLDPDDTLTEITVVTDDGAVLRGDNAWIAVLWAVAATRRRAVALARGRRRWSLRAVKGAAETMRAIAGDGSPRRRAAAPTPGRPLPPPVLRPPSACPGCADA